MRTMSGSPCLHYNCLNRNSFGYCKTTVCINERYQLEQWGLPSTTNKCESVVIKQQTNADRIRAMTDEEMAELMAQTGTEYSCPPPHYFAETGFCRNEDVDMSCRMCWLDWLKQEAVE